MILVPDLRDIVANAQSDAERRVAELLARIADDPDAVAFHSIKLRSHAYKQQAEADFVALWRGVVIVIEVKGGGVRKHDGSWYSIDRYGDWHKLGSSPMEQARSGMYALRDILEEEGVGWYPQEAIVITPDIDDVPHSVEFKPSHWLAMNAMTPEAMTTSLNVLRADAQTPPRGKRLARQADLRERLFGEFTRMPVIDALRGAVLDEQNRATEDQARFLAGMARNDRLMIYGGAGTGKSLALVEGVKQEAGAGRSVLITYFSPALTDFFGPRVEGRGVDVFPIDSIPADRRYDVLFVDEAQDVMTAEMMDRLGATLDGGLAHGRWRMFLDPNNQAHVDGRFDEMAMDLVADMASVSYDLSTNVRNTRAIVHVVQEYLGADVGDPGIVNGRKVEWRMSNRGGGIDEALGIARGLVESGIRPRDIWVISATRTGAPYKSPEGIVVTSPRHAKGLEAEHVVVCDLPEAFDDAGLAQLYVAVTRARVSLWILRTHRDDKRLQALAKERMVLH